MALIILFSRGKQREWREGRKGSDRGSIEDGPENGDEPARGPLCAAAQNKRKEPAKGGAPFWVGKGRGGGVESRTRKGEER